MSNRSLEMANIRLSYWDVCLNHLINANKTDLFNIHVINYHTLLKACLCEYLKQDLRVRTSEVCVHLSLVSLFKLKKNNIYIYINKLQTMCFSTAFEIMGEKTTILLP